MCAYVRVCVRVCVSGCVRACVRVCVCVCVSVPRASVNNMHNRRVAHLARCARNAVDVTEQRAMSPRAVSGQASLQAVGRRAERPLPRHHGADPSQRAPSLAIWEWPRNRSACCDCTEYIFNAVVVRVGRSHMFLGAWAAVPRQRAMAQTSSAPSVRSESGQRPPRKQPDLADHAQAAARSE